MARQCEKKTPTKMWGGTLHKCRKKGARIPSGWCTLFFMSRLLASKLVLTALGFLLGIPPAQAQSSVQITQYVRAANGLIQLDAQAPSGEVCVVQQAASVVDSFFDMADGTRTARVDGSVSWLMEAGVAPWMLYRVRTDAPRALLAWADVVEAMAGTFAVPMAEDGDYRFGYSSGVHAQLTNGNLLVAGHPYYDRQAQVQVPSILDGREGTRVGGWVDITGGLLPEGWSAGEESYVLGGLLETGGRLYFTKHQWYNGAGTDWQTQGFYEGELDGGGVASGLWTVSNEYAHHSRVGGYMCLPPDAIQAAGYVYLAGLEGTSGAALGRWGPNLFAMALTGGSVTGLPLLCHPSQGLQAPDVRAVNATSAWWVANRPSNEVWWIANKVTSIQWIETEAVHGVLCFVYRGLGQTWYGDASGGPGLPDPYGGGSGYHAEGWALQAWIYDPAEVLDVFRGARDPWSLAPVEAVLLTERLPGSSSETHHSFFTGTARAELKTSLRGNRLVVLQENEYPASEWESTPKGYVFDLP